jgi:hypothetical protein
MLVQINPHLCINDSQIVSMTTIPGSDEPTTQFHLRGHPVVEAKGDWISRIVRAKKLGAVWVSRTHIEQRS